MNKEANFHLLKLLEEFRRRKNRNQTYSLRAYARHLGIPASSLALILKGDRKVPQRRVESLCQKLGLSQAETQIFRMAAERSKASLKNLVSQTEPVLPSSKKLNDAEHSKIISEWEHYAFLSLMDTQDFSPKADWIAKRLGISVRRVDAVLNQLLKYKLILRDDRTGLITKNRAHVTTTDGVPSSALRKAHEETLELAIRKLNNLGPDERNYSAITVATSPARILEANEMIREFRRRLMGFLEDEEKSEVYRVMFLVFPLSEGEVNYEKSK